MMPRGGKVWPSCGRVELLPVDPPQTRAGNGFGDHGIALGLLFAVMSLNELRTPLGIGLGMGRNGHRQSGDSSLARPAFESLKLPLIPAGFGPAVV